MKHFEFLTISFLLMLNGFLLSPLAAQNLNGSWSLQGSENHLLLIQDDYFAWTETNDQDEFISTLGGEVAIEGGKLKIKIQFNSSDQYLVGESFETTYKLEDNKLTTLHPEGYELKWNRMAMKDQGLAGVWRISGRKTDGEMKSYNRSARKTYKLLTPGHFQWIAMNTDTGEFFGTGGGTYTFENGKYTEHIEFFSRDNNKVGMSLSFNGEVKNGDWHHSGKSSKGVPIYEVWSKETEY